MLQCWKFDQTKEKAMKHKNTFVVILMVLILTTLACSLGNDGDSGEAELPPDVLFQDDFSDPNSGWDRVEVDEGVTDYVDGKYRIFINTDNTDVWANPGLDFANIVIEVEATKVAGPDDNDLGLICRYQDISNFYFFIISSDGFYGIAKVVDGEQILIGAENMEYTETINQGNATNKLRADCVGEHLVLHVNGEKLLDVTDTDYAKGDVGLIAGTFDVTGTDIYFDNFVVKKP